MKVVFLNDDFPPQSFGGAGISTYELARAVYKAGHEVEVITTCRKEVDAGVRIYDELKVHTIATDYPDRWRGYRSIYNPPAIRQLRKLLKEIEPDIVHANNVHFYLSYHSLKIAKKYAKGVVVTLRDAMSFSYGKLATKKYLESFDAQVSLGEQIIQAKKRWNPFRNMLIRYYLKVADTRFAVSDALRKALENNGIRGVDVMHTGVDLSIYEYKKEVLGKNVLFPGRLSAAKGSAVVEKAMEKVLKVVPDARLVEVDTSKAWVGRVDMNKAYEEANIVLVPSVSFDAFPRSVIEAMAIGRAVIGTCFGGAPEAIQDGKTGYVVNPFNIDELAERIITLLKADEKRASFGKVAREIVESHFNIKDKATELIKAYEEIR